MEAPYRCGLIEPNDLWHQLKKAVTIEEVVDWLNLTIFDTDIVNNHPPHWVVDWLNLTIFDTI